MTAAQSCYAYVRGWHLGSATCGVDQLVAATDSDRSSGGRGPQLWAVWRWQRLMTSPLPDICNTATYGEASKLLRDCDRSKLPLHTLLTLGDNRPNHLA